MPHATIEDRRAYSREYYQRNQAVQAAKQNERRRKRRADLREWLNSVKLDNPCSCGEGHLACLDFHHRDPSTKSFEIADGFSDGYSVQRMKDEVAKCDVLCANCHRKVHWNPATQKVDTSNVYL